MILRLRSGSVTPLRRPRNELGGVDVSELDFEMAAENVAHDFGLAGAEQAVVDKDAGELIADGLVEEARRRRWNRRRR